ncbi:MAG: PLD nuclease N-terminal domain-containing protein [Acidimicrobiales bacterium]|jgi:hypothetical protein
MFRLLGSGLLGFALVAVWIYCILDVIASDDALIRNLPKMAWLLVVAFIPTVGAIAWLALGRPLYAGWRPGDTTIRATPAVTGPEDTVGFSLRNDDQSRQLQAWEDDLARRERELREGGDDDPKP